MTKAWRSGLPLLALLAGCIPHVDTPGPPSAAARGDAAPEDDARSPPGADDAEAVRAANAEQLARGPAPVAEVPLPPSRPRPRPHRAEPTDMPAAVPARPAWEARPVSPDAAVVAEGSYTVRSGDTLGRIAAATGAGAEAIARANALDPAATLRSGQRLAIPGGRYHLVRPGEAGIAIARAYGVAWSRIVEANGLTEPFLLHVGQRVLIPGPAGSRSAAAERAAAFSLDVDDILTGGEPALAAHQAPAQPVASAARVLAPSAQVALPARLSGGFAWPVQGTIVSRFGPGRSGERNDGIAIAAPIATPIHAAADGVVVYAGTGIAALGGIVIVRHGSGWTSVYGHASKLLVRRGQSVRRGQTVALSGDTGSADRPEVHFELRRGRTPVDPTTQLPALRGS